MTVIAWTSTTGGDWSDPANWSGGVTPGPNDDAILNLGAAETITLSTVMVVNSVAFNDPAATYVETAGASLTTAGAMLFQGADFNLHGTLASGGDMTLISTGPFDLTSVTLAAATVSIRASTVVVATLLNSGLNTSIPAGPGNGIALTAGAITVLNSGLNTPTPAGPGNGITLTAGSITISCFLQGTRIATARGAVPVEELTIGEPVITDSSDPSPIIWIGRRALDCRRHPDPASVWPVRVSAGAFAEAVPNRDLWLSRDHAVFVDGVLIPIGRLTNGVSIEQIPVDDVTYYHVELAHHAVLLANALPVESWLDTGDRANFANAGPVIRQHPDFASRGAAVADAWETRGCAPLTVTGPILTAVRDRLNQRARALFPARAAQLRAVGRDNPVTRRSRVF